MERPKELERETQRAMRRLIVKERAQLSEYLALCHGSIELGQYGITVGLQYIEGN
jgi:hypothetical protein